MEIREFFRDLPTRIGRVTTTKLRREIDGLRFFAIFPVVFGHICERVLRTQKEAGRLSPEQEAFCQHFLNHAAGVILFFVISGYIIATQMRLVDRDILTGSYLRKYFWRRATRILPPYFLVLFTTFALVSCAHLDLTGARHFNASKLSLPTSLAASLLYSHGWITGEFPKLFAPGWTLELEIQFYLGAPFILFAYFTTKRGAVRTGLGVLILLFAILTANAIPNQSGLPHLSFTIAKYFQYFWLGVLMVDLQDEIKKRTIKPAVLSCVGLFGLAGYFIVHWPALGHDPELLQPQFALMLCIVAIFAAVFSPETVLWRFCAQPHISLIGSACYSIYLTHLQQVFIYGKLISGKFHFNGVQEAIAINLLIQVPLITIGSMIFYYFVERPCMTKDWPQKLFARLHQSGHAVRPEV